MTESVVLAVVISLAGGLGAVLRHTVDEGVRRRGVGARWGTLLVNVSGSFLLGLLVGVAPSDFWIGVLGVGLLGGYTTFSTAMLQAVEATGEDRTTRVRAGALAVAMLVACVTAATMGVLVAGPVGAGG